MLRIFSALERESYIVLLFTATHIWIQAKEWYVPLLALYILALFLVSRDGIKTVWIAFLSTLPFQYGWYRETVFFSPTFPEALPLPMPFGIFYADVLLLLLYIFVLWKKKPPFYGVPEQLFIPVIILGCISSWFARFPAVSLFGLLTLGKYFLSYVVAKKLLTKQSYVKLSLEIMFLFLLFNSILIVMQKFHGGPLGIIAENFGTRNPNGKFADEIPNVYRPGGILDDPNVLSSLYAMLMPLLLIFSIGKNIVHRGFAQIVLLFSWISIVFAASRTGIIAACFSFIAVWLLYKRKKNGIYFLFRIKFLAIGLLLFTFTTLPFIVIRLKGLETIFGPTGGGTFRLIHFKTAYEFMRSHPFGVGLNMSQYEIAIRFPPAYYMNNSSEIHNIFLQIGASLGIFGLVLFLAFFFFLIREKIEMARQSKNPALSYGFIGVIMEYLFLAFFFPWLLHTVISGFFWVLAAYTTVISPAASRQKQETGEYQKETRVSA